MTYVANEIRADFAGSSPYDEHTLKQYDVMMCGAKCPVIILVRANTLFDLIDRLRTNRIVKTLDNNELYINPEMVVSIRGPNQPFSSMTHFDNPFPKRG